jgi:hypothetical protein
MEMILRSNQKWDIARALVSEEVTIRTNNWAN